MNHRVLVFGREPSPGTVKTRLAAGIGDRAAVGIYGVLLQNTLEVAQECAENVELWLAETPSVAFGPPPSVSLAVQRGTCLGERMADAFNRSFDDGADRVVLIGSDCPQITAGHLQQAMAGLDDRPVVLGPAKDGGYWLVAQRAPGVDLFSGVPWSHQDTLAATRKRLQTFGVEWSELDSLLDLDTVEDLETVVTHRKTPAALAAKLREAMRRTRG